MSEQEIKRINIYCDESRQSGQRYMVLGGIWLSAEKEIAFNEECHKFRSSREGLLRAYLKWVKATSKTYLPYYKQFVDIFFKFPDIRFNCIVVDTHKVDYAKYHENDKELAFYKFYFFLLTRNMNKNLKHLVFLDRRTDKKRERLSTLKYRINNYFLNRTDITHDVVSNMRYDRKLWSGS